MAIALVQSKGASGNSGTSLSVSSLAATTAGNLLVALVSIGNNPGDRTFTPPANWVQAGTEVQDDVFISVDTAVFYYPNNPGGITSVAVTASGSTSAWHIYVLEFSGVATSSPLDVTTAREQGTGTTPSSGAVTTTADGDLLVGWSLLDEVSGASDCTVTQPAGYTGLTRLNDGGGWLSDFPAWAVAGTAGSYNYAPTKSRSDTEGVFTIVAFKAATGGGSTPLTAQAGLMVLKQSASATLAVAVALQSPSPATGVLIGSSATLLVAVSLVAPSAALAVLIAPNAQISLGGELTAQAGLMHLVAPGAATLSIALALVSPAPALMELATGASPAALLVVVALVAPSPALLRLVTLGAVFSGIAGPGRCALSDAAVALVLLADAAVASIALSDGAVGTLTLSDKEAEL